MKTLSILVAASIALPSAVRADDAALLQRVTALEKRVADLEARLAPVLEAERVKEVVKHQQELAKERMMADGDFYSRPDLQIIEKLYQTANSDWKSEEARQSLKLLIERYPLANRTGCATLYLGQMTTGDEQLGYLNAAIEKFGNCRYGDGVQVGPYARLFLAMRCKRDGDSKKAKELFEEIKAKYPDAIDHHGKLLTTYFADME